MVDFIAGFDELAFAEFAVVAAVNCEAVVTADLLPVFSINCGVIVCFDVAEPIVLSGQMAVVFDGFGAVVFGEQIQVFLGMNVDLFFARFVFKAQFVTAFTLVGLGFQGGAGFMLWQRVGRCIGCVVCRRFSTQLSK
tara:strand:- start:61 stop:471 length:411 start_codon:yes stop_codon:yes gene_type:complete